LVRGVAEQPFPSRHPLVIIGRLGEMTNVAALFIAVAA